MLRAGSVAMLAHALAGCSSKAPAHPPSDADAGHGDDAGIRDAGIPDDGGAPEDAGDDAAPCGGDLVDHGFADDGSLVSSAGSALAVAIQPDGKIVVGGTQGRNRADGSYSTVMLERLNPDGSVDEAFGDVGVVTVEPNVTFPTLSSPGIYPLEGVVSIALLGDGSILAASDCRSEYNGSKCSPTSSSWDAAVVRRFQGDGSLDPSFGDGGAYVWSDGFNTYSFHVRAMTVLADGRIVLAGGTSTGDFFLVGLTADGDIDSGFGDGGMSRTPSPRGGLGMIDAIAVDDGGAIVSAGYDDTTFETCNPCLAVLRHDAAGTLDATFGGGVVLAETPATSTVARALTLGPDGEIVVAGYRQEAGQRRFLVAAYDSVGTLDATFGTDGVVIDTFDGAADPYDDAYAALWDADGGIVVAGLGRDGVNMGFGLARLTAAGELDPCFATGGRFTETFTLGVAARAVALQDDGKVVACGADPTDPSLPAGFVAARYRP